MGTQTTSKDGPHAQTKWSQWHILRIFVHNVLTGHNLTGALLIFVFMGLPCVCLHVCMCFLLGSFFLFVRLSWPALFLFLLLLLLDTWDFL